MRKKTCVRLAVAVLALGGLVSCGGSSPSSPSNDPPVETNTITITSSGVSPANIVINAGTRVTFVNNDGRSHNMTSDPHPDHTDCTELNQVGFLASGQSRESGNLVTVRTCGFHDHDNPNASSLRGQITIR
jgi:plastocyanin